jgi:divalent metal cation (Fe/Co/Zn/Cd) transporter
MESIMGIGSGIFLFIAGAIVAYALNFNVKWVDQNLIGYLLMGGGAVVFLISMVATFKKRSTTVTTHSAVDSSAGERSTSAETKSDTL